MYFYITNTEGYEPREKTRRIPKGKNTNSDGLRIRTGNRRSFLFDPIDNNQAFQEQKQTNIRFDERLIRFDVRFSTAYFTRYFYITNAEEYEPREKHEESQGKKYKLGWFEDQDWQPPVLSFFQY